VKVPILTYHSARVLGHDYADNDHVALARDLRAIHGAGFQIVPLGWIVDWVRGERGDGDVERAVGLSFDDGCSLDFRTLTHPTWGPQRSFHDILADFRDEVGHEAQPHLHATCFVIASPDARRDIARRCYLGDEWNSDEWWAAAAASELLSIQNHTWDHNHPEVDETCQKDGHKGRFDVIDTFAECDAEITRAAEYIAAKTAPHWPDLLAYPWGESSAYLREEFLPRFGDRHRTRAAFGAHDGYVTREANLWSLPRLGLGANWTDPDGFRALLDGALAR
jgi:hypothetical protein